MSYTEKIFSLPDRPDVDFTAHWTGNFVEQQWVGENAPTSSWPQINGAIVGIRLSMTLIATSVGRLKVWAPNGRSPIMLIDEIFDTGTHSIITEPVFDKKWDGGLNPITYTSLNDDGNSNYGFPIIETRNCDDNFDGTGPFNRLYGAFLDMKIHLIYVPNIINCI